MWDKKEMKGGKIYEVLLLAALLSLAGCTYSVEQLAKDENLRAQIIKDCVGKGLKAMDDQNCINAGKAQAQVTGNKIKDLFE